MTTPLLETKLYAPRWRRGLIARPRLIDRLKRGAESKLTLVSAPAGFGKTTLLAAWLAAGPDPERSSAWVSLDESDNHPTSFWTYLITALQRMAPGLGADALSLLESTQPAIQDVLAMLLNELAALPNDVVLVLDDYHVIDARDIQHGMVFLLDHLPAQLHLVIARRDRPGRAGNRQPAHGVPEHHADAHQEHLHEARGEQPAVGGTPSRRARAAAPNLQALNHHINHHMW